MAVLLSAHLGSEAEIAAAIVLVASLAITVAWIWHLVR